MRSIDDAYDYRDTENSLFGIDEEGLTLMLFVIGNVAFFMYDIAMTKLITYYLLGLRKKFRIEKYFKK